MLGTEEGKELNKEKQLEERLRQLKKEAWIKNIMKILGYSEIKATQEYFKIFKND